MKPVVVIASIALLLAGCGEDDDAVTQAATEAEGAVEQAEQELEAADTSALVDELRAQGLNTLASAIETIGMENVISGTSFTLFAPQDEAWLSLGADGLGSLLGDPERAAELLQSHVVDERLSSTDLAGSGEVESSSGRSLTIEGEGTELTVDGASITEADIEVGGGVVHVVDGLVAADLLEPAQG